MRDKAGLTQFALADKIGVNRQAVGRWEKMEFPHLKDINQVCQALNISIPEFFSVGTSGLNIKDIDLKLFDIFNRFPDSIQIEIIDIITTIFNVFQSGKHHLK